MSEQNSLLNPDPWEKAFFWVSAGIAAAATATWLTVTMILKRWAIRTLTDLDSIQNIGAKLGDVEKMQKSMSDKYDTHIRETDERVRDYMIERRVNSDAMTRLTKAHEAHVREFREHKKTIYEKIDELKDLLITKLSSQERE